MTYTTKRILANFLHNGEGLLSKRFIETAELFYGKVAAKRAFIEALRCAPTSSKGLLENRYIPIPYSREVDLSQINSFVYDNCSDWFPGRCERLQASDGSGNRFFNIWQVVPYSASSMEHPSDDQSWRWQDLFCEQAVSSRQMALDAEPTLTIDHVTLSQINLSVRTRPYDPERYSRSDARNALSLANELLFENVYDSVTAQCYNRPADAVSLRRYFMTLMRNNPQFDWSRWSGPTGIVHKDMSEMMQTFM